MLFTVIIIEIFSCLHVRVRVLFKNISDVLLRFVVESSRESAQAFQVTFAVSPHIFSNSVFEDVAPCGDL